MSSELSPQEKRILERYLARRNAEPEVPAKAQNPVVNFINVGQFSVEALLASDKIFFSDKQDGDQFIGVAVALEEALTEMNPDGIVASMPYLIAGKAKANRDRKNSANTHWLWKQGFHAFTEENIILDKKGKPVVYVVHGGGILTPERIRKAYKEGLTDQYAATLTTDESSGLLEGKLPNGQQIQIYTVEDVRQCKVSNPFGQYAVVVDFETAKATKSDYLSKDEFKSNELVIARAGTLNYLDEYFEKAKLNSNKVGNWHRLTEIDPSQPQGRLLFLNDNDDGLDGDNYLINLGRFVGVAPEAHGARK